MPSESSLLVTQVPASFATIGEKHNALVDLLRTMTGSGMAKVTFSENKIIIAVPTFEIPDPLYVDQIYANYINAGTFQATSGISTPDLASTTASFSNLYVSGSIYSISVPAVSITKNISLKEIDVCSGGVAKKMLILASDPY